MKIISLKIIALFAVASMLSACGASEPSPWTKKSSPWDQRPQKSQHSSIDAEAPAAATYKEELAAVDQSVQAVELNYQSEAVDSVVPEEAPAVEESPAVAEDNTPATNDVISAEDEVLNQPADYYTVQLMASVDSDRAYKFAEKHQLSSRYIVATHRGDTVWYVLLLGLYPDYSTAKAEMADIAGRLKTTPWVRKLGGIQKLMR